MIHATPSSGPTFALILAILGFVSLGCQSPKLIEKSKPQVDDDTVSHLLNPRRLSPETRHQLHQAGYGRRTKTAPVAEIRKLEAQWDGAPSLAQRTALAELLSDAAGLRKEKDPAASFELFLSAAEVSYPGAIKASAASKEDDDLLALYNHACGQVTELAFATGQSSGVAGRFTWRTAMNRPGLVNPLEFDELKVAEYLKIKGFERREVELGAGGALVGHWNYREEFAESDPFFPEEGMALPLTATLDFKGDGQVELAVYDSLMVDFAPLDGTTVPLATDYTAPLALIMTLRPEKNVGIKSMFQPSKYLELAGLFQLEPFREDKIPVIMVHGLSKSPSAWVPAVNELRSDPVIRENYQFLLFQYPSGLPATYCGSMLRHYLSEFQNHHDPGRRRQVMRNMVLVGKSFGGITSSQQIRESGEKIRELFSTRPLDEVGLSEHEVEAIRRLFHFQPNPDIRRTIFMGTPHRGTDVADTKAAHLASRVINYPFSLLLDGNQLPDSDAITPLARDYLQNPPNSVVNLRANSPVLATIASLPIGSRTTVHSIVGKRGDGPLEESDDKMVPYWSSHIDEAVSEVVVPCIHGELESHPKSVAELRRILLLHLAEEA